MARFIFGNPEIVLGFGCGLCLRKSDQNLLEALYGLLKAIKLELRLPLPKDDLGDKILRRQISDEAVVLFTI
jgi:hypothetical protein